jgi:hypothetical protein
MQYDPSWEAHSHWAMRETFRLLRNPKVHYSLHNSLSLHPILGQMIWSTSSNAIQDQFNTTVLTVPSSFKWPHFFVSLWLKCLRISYHFHACYMLLTSHYPLFQHHGNIYWRVQITKLTTSQLSQFQFPVLKSFLSICPSPKPCVTFLFYRKELLASLTTLTLDDLHPLSVVRDW